MITKTDFNQIKFTKESKRKPTPDKWRKIGKTINRVSKIVAGATIFTGNPLIPFLALVLGEIGETITDFASD